MAQKLKFGNGTWATKKGSTLAYNDENNNYKPLPFTTTRDSIATRVNKEGLIEVVSNDVPRIDYTDSTDGVLLLEPSSVNYCENSYDASQWSNVVSNGIVTKTANYSISPDGTQNATRLQASVSGSGYALISLALTSAFEGSYTSFVYVKSNTESSQSIAFYGRNTDVSEHTVGTEWTKIEFKGSSSSGQTNYAYLGVSTTVNFDTDIDISVWGGQLEQGSYPTSYIPTNGSSVTRLADTASGSGNSEVFNDSEGVLFADIFIEENIDSNVNISVSRGVNGVDLFKIIYLPVDGILRAELRDSTNFINLDYNDFSLGQYNKVLVTYDSLKYKMYINGFKIAVLSTSVTPSGLNQLDFDRADGNSPFYGKTKELGYYDTALTDAELEYLTSYRSLNELVTELNLNTL